MYDYEMQNHGSLYLLDPMTKEAQNHASAHFSDAQHLGRVIAIEPRYAHEVAHSLLSDGFTVDLDGRELVLA